MRKTEAKASLRPPRAPASNERGNTDGRGHFDASIALPRPILPFPGAINGHFSSHGNAHLTRRTRTDGGLRHFLLFQIKHSPLAPKIASGRGSLRKQDRRRRRRRRQPINAFLANGRREPRPTDRFFLSRIISRRLLRRRRCRRLHRRRPTCHYPGQAKTIGGISGDLLSRASE